MRVRSRVAWIAGLWLVAAVLVYLAPEKLLPAGWRRELLAVLALPVILACAALIGGLMEVSFVALTRVLVRCISFGRIRVEGANEYVKTRWGVGRGYDGRLVLDEDLAGFLVILLAVLVVTVVVYLL